MRLHRLSLGAIGPFAASYDLDLDAVATGGIFLLEGPTGAGKSTILDAVTFAFYGDVAGREASKDRLHTDFPTALEPFVELEFSVGGVRHRIHRTPTHDRLRRDGSATTTVQTTVRLWRLEPDEELLSNRVREADMEVRRLLGGLSSEQFRQVVVLPQGEFATFLRASADERRDVLQRLFATDHYKRIEEELISRRRSAQTRLGEADQQVRDALVALKQASALGDDLDVDSLVAASDRERGARLDDLEASIGLAVLTSGQEVAVATASVDAVAKTRDALVRRVELSDRLTSALARRAELHEAESAILASVARVRAAEQARTLAPVLAEAHVRAGAVDSARAAIDTLPAESTDVAIEDIDADAMRLKAEVLRAQSSALEPVIVVESGLAMRLGELAALTARVEVLAANRQVLAERVAASPHHLLALRAELDAVSAQAARVEALTGKLAILRAKFVAWAELPALATALQIAKADVLAVATTAHDAREAYLRALKIRLEGMAAELATRLRDGVPCAVCGATEHPEPARPSLDAIDELTLHELDVASHEVLATLELARERATKADGDLARAREAAGDADPAHELAAVMAELVSAERAVEARAELVAAISQADTGAEVDRVSLAELVLELATSQIRLGAFSGEVIEEQRIVEASRGPYPSVADLRARLVERAAGAESLARAVLVLRAAEASEVSARHLSDRAAREAGFASAADAAASVLDADVLHGMNEKIQAHQRAVTVVAEELARPEVAGADAEAPDLVPVLADVEEAERVRDSALMRADDARRRVAAVRHCRDELRRAETLTAEVRASTRPVLRVADAVTGQASVNPRRISLSTYVLRERFDSVVRAASRRLEHMSSGRYVLEPDEATRGQGKAGLGLVVLDQWTSARRDTATLSGGESFYASLALALGLADVVRDEVGGVELETLFIDEGFGTLDADTLESVLEVIDSLRDGGRVVGIVSHVSDVKDRIRDRIEVRPLPDGTSSVSIRT